MPGRRDFVAARRGELTAAAGEGWTGVQMAAVGVSGRGTAPRRPKVLNTQIHSLGLNKKGLKLHDCSMPIEATVCTEA